MCAPTLEGMHVLLGILVLLHVICWAAAFGIWVAAARTREPNKGMAHAAGGALVFGLIAMIIGMATGDGGHLFYTIKLLLAIVVTACSFVAINRRTETPAAVWYLIPVGIVLNMVVGVFHLGA